ncbi:MAG TPA: Fe-S-binding domain-containing protein, partial [Holophaga sp.]|nr:Fe-S-binding domain-containing protein [Holophaga sp.]
MTAWYQNLPLWVTAVPLIGALLLLLVPRERRRAFELGALAVTVFDFLLSVPLWFQYDRSSAAVQWALNLDWIPSIGARFNIGMDGISLVLFLLTTFIGFIAVWCSFTAIQERHKEYYIWLLVMQFSMLGVFICQDVFLFYLFWELMLVPMYFLIAIWGGP